MGICIERGPSHCAEAYTDPDVPPLPPHVTFKQAKGYAAAILNGDPDARDIIKSSAKQIFA